jgi:hypothetical protein
MSGGIGYRPFYRSHDWETVRLLHPKPFAAAPVMQQLDMASRLMDLNAAKYDLYPLPEALLEHKLYISVAWNQVLEIKYGLTLIQFRINISH